MKRTIDGIIPDFLQLLTMYNQTNIATYALPLYPAYYSYLLVTAGQSSSVRVSYAPPFIISTLDINIRAFHQYYQIPRLAHECQIARRSLYQKLALVSDVSLTQNEVSAFN